MMVVETPPSSTAATPPASQPGRIEDTPAKSLKDQIESLSKAVALIAIGLYIIGLLTVNAYLYTLGVSDFSTLKPRYIYTGFVVTLSITITVVSGYFGYKLFRNMRRIHRTTTTNGRAATDSESPSILFQLLLLLARAGAGSFLLYLPFALYALAIIDAREFLPTRQFFVEVSWIYALSLLIGCLIYFSAVSVVRRFTWNVELLEELYAIPSRPLLVYGFVVVLTILIAYYLIAFARNVYPAIPEQFGGGKPKIVEFLFEQDVVDGLRQQEIAIPESGHWSEPMGVAFENETIYVLRLESGSVIQIDKDVIKAVRLIRPSIVEGFPGGGGSW
jgi:hypothetical protein